MTKLNSHIPKNDYPITQFHVATSYRKQQCFALSLTNFSDQNIRQNSLGLGGNFFFFSWGIFLFQGYTNFPKG